MLENEFQKQVIEVAKYLGWKVFHDYDSRRNESGFPDLVLIHPKRGRLLFRELKKADGRVRPEQKDWLLWLSNAGEDAGVWRPSDMDSGRIQRELQR